ncbi:MAG: alkaline phosphatase family protein [Chloroflexi bacterium]|nr:alkaline phosphatase family protein [Chloroflexota bacterium]
MQPIEQDDKKQQGSGIPGGPVVRGPGARFRAMAQWLLSKLSMFLILTTDFLYTKKYDAVSRQLGYEPAKGHYQEKGFVIVQIDALAYDHLHEAMARGYAPTLKRLVERRNFRCERYRCGLPSSTPSVQAGIMFGENFDIPAFRWYDKETNRSLVCKFPGLLRSVQAQVSDGRTGILRGGSSYVNMLDGGAANATFTLSAVAKRGFLGSVKGLGFLFLFLISPFRSIRMVLYILAEYFIELAQRIRSYFSSRPRVKHEGIFPFLRIICNVIFREMETFGIITDMYRGVPAIYATYNGYDEMAHHFGPTTRAAFKVVRSIDRQIRTIDRIRRHCGSRDYDLYVISDHGQTPATPFSHLYGMTLGKYVAQHIREGVGITEDLDEEEFPITHREAHFLVEELEQAESRVSKTSARLVSGIRSYVDQRFPEERELESWDMAKRDDVVVTNSSSFANIYFNVTTRKLDLSEIEELHPGLVDRLVEHDGVAMVVAREGDHVVVMSKTGRMSLNNQEMVSGRNPLEQFEEPEWAAEELCYITSFPHGGDLIVYGAYRNGQVVTFEEQLGGHGGIGGVQAYPFLLFPETYNIDVASIMNAKQLYNYFVDTYKL